jgi:drug/metabolite transporter (DMT)-like permease
MQRRDDVPRGILLMIASTVLFAVWSAIAKWEVAFYPVGEVMFARSLSSLIACATFILPFTGLSVFATRRRRDHIGRGLSQSISQTFSVIAFSLMPLAGAIAINFSAPLWAALLSVIWLKERAGPARWTALLAGFLGVLIVTNPGADSLTVGALFALGNAVMYGSVTVAVRGMTKTESANTLLMWQMVKLISSVLLGLWRSTAHLGNGVGNTRLVGAFLGAGRTHLAAATANSTSGLLWGLGPPIRAAPAPGRGGGDDGPGCQAKMGDSSSCLPRLGNGAGRNGSPVPHRRRRSVTPPPGRQDTRRALRTVVWSGHPSAGPVARTRDTRSFRDRTATSLPREILCPVAASGTTRKCRRRAVCVCYWG